jgi:hypothetical protein
MSFADYSELLECVTHLSDESARATMSERGRLYADTRYGAPEASVQSVARALGITRVSSHSDV